MKKRRRARELALQTLYSEEFTGNDLDTLLRQLKNRAPEEVFDFASSLVTKVMTKDAFLDKHVASSVKNWEYNRIAVIDRIILKIALCELLFFEEIPPRVSINEAIDLAKTFSTVNSGKFVNGIIDNLYKKFQAQGKIKKKGKGLLNKN
ncbi:MAG: transcription antitermination factor NusB [bacterium]